MSQENEEELGEVQPSISLEFETPEFGRHEVYPVILEDGTTVFRTPAELERAKGIEKEAREEEAPTS